MADQVLHSGVRGITDLMVMPGLINLDFADVRTVMSEMGKAMMGTGEAEGEKRAIQAAEAAISNPLLDEVSMKGAKGVLINITGSMDMTLFEVDEAANRIRAEVDPDTLASYSWSRHACRLFANLVCNGHRNGLRNRETIAFRICTRRGGRLDVARAARSPAGNHELAKGAQRHTHCPCPARIAPRHPGHHCVVRRVNIRSVDDVAGPRGCSGGLDHHIDISQGMGDIRFSCEIGLNPFHIGTVEARTLMFNSQEFDVGLSG